jgi:hypothetical protein
VESRWRATASALNEASRTNERETFFRRGAPAPGNTSRRTMIYYSTHHGLFIHRPNLRTVHRAVFVRLLPTTGSLLRDVPKVGVDRNDRDSASISAGRLTRYDASWCQPAMSLVISDTSVCLPEKTKRAQTTVM